MEKILIVDDSPLQAAQLKSILEDEYDISVVQTAEDGLRQAASAEYSLILLDVVMPGMDGLETAQAIMEQHPEARIIMLSSLAGMRNGQIPLTLVLVALLYLGQEVYSILFVRDSVANFMHIVGGACGTLFGFALAKKGQKF